MSLTFLKKLTGIKMVYFILLQIANAMVINWAGPPAMISLFRKMFGSHSCPDIVRRNNFTNFQHYFLQKALVVAMSKQRNIHGICPPEILKFVLDLFKYNDNSRNKVSVLQGILCL